MSLEEARNVMWLLNNHRPLGELLDEGYLNETRLEWAAEKAYDPRLRQAAKTLLDWLRQSPRATADKIAPTPSAQSFDTSLQIGIPIEQARTTIWPFSPYKGQLMGPLAETKQITLKDLGYAIENAWDERVRRASMALLLVRLKQAIQEPPPAAGYLHVVACGRSYAERQQFLFTFIKGSFLGAALMAWVALFIWSLNRQFATQSARPLSAILASPSGIVALAIVLVARSASIARN